MPLQSLSLPSHVSMPWFVISHVQTFPVDPGAGPHIQVGGQSAGVEQFCEQRAMRLQSLHWLFEAQQPWFSHLFGGGAEAATQSSPCPHSKSLSPH